MSHNAVTIKTASQAELEILLQWAKDEGWNPGISDAPLFHSADPDGYFMAYHNNSPAAGISVIKQGQTHGFLGLYICHPDFRSKGYGWAVWQTGMDYLQGRVIGLDGVVEQQANYRKSGFKFAYRNIRYQGSTLPLLQDANGLSDHDAGSAGSAGSALTCEPLARKDHVEVITLDAQVHGHDRTQLLSAWITDVPGEHISEHNAAPSSQPKSRHTRVCRVNGRIEGFATIRQCQSGFKVGPLIGSSTEIAKELLTSLVIQTNATQITVDVPEPNQAAIALMEQISLKPVFETARMYRGERPDSSLNALFGVTSFELG